MSFGKAAERLKGDVHIVPKSLGGKVGFVERETESRCAVRRFKTHIVIDENIVTTGGENRLGVVYVERLICRRTVNVKYALRILGVPLSLVSRYCGKTVFVTVLRFGNIDRELKPEVVVGICVKALSVVGSPYGVGRGEIPGLVAAGETDIPSIGILSTVMCPFRTFSISRIFSYKSVIFCFLSSVSQAIFVSVNMIPYKN